MRDLSLLCWDLDKSLDEPEVLIPAGPLFHRTLISYEADSLATDKLLSFILQTADGVVDFWSFGMPSAFKKHCVHLGALQLRGLAACVHLYGDTFSGYIADTGCAIFFDWKTLVTSSELVNYSSLRLLRKCKDVCRLSTGLVLVVDSDGVTLYPPPPCFKVHNVRQAEYDTTIAPIWRLEQSMVDYIYRIVPADRSAEEELCPIGTIISKNSAMNLFIQQDNLVTVSSTSFDHPIIGDTFVGRYRAATARTVTGVTDTWYLRFFSISADQSSPSSSLSCMVAHPEVKLGYPGGLTTHKMGGILHFRLDEQSGRAVIFVRALGGKHHLVVFDLI
ncbi:hypothetical protein FRB95_012366 [Tulasnella sp. JGI-2019a]|nr:hypothetical protein FRB95_012366 [Tulasnella sp. JGI-2019a]